MKRNIVLTVIACLCLLALSVYGRAPQIAGARAWDYKQTCSAKDLDKLGAEGWELVTATSPSSAVTCFYLKRPKP